jgi:replicative DNA helicase
MTKKQLKLIHVMDDPMREDKVYAEASRLVAEYPDIGLIGIDYASKMLQGRPAGVESMSSIYAACGDLSKNLGVPVILIAGVSRGYVGGEPDVNHIWYSGLAEHEASLIVLVHNPALLDVDMSSNNRANLPYVEGMGYLKFGACRYGMKQGSLGAAQVAWNEKKGNWGDKTAVWYPRYAG